MGLELLLVSFGDIFPVFGLNDLFGVSGGVIPLPFVPPSFSTFAWKLPLCSNGSSLKKYALLF